MICSNKSNWMEWFVWRAVIDGSGENVTTAAASLPANMFSSWKGPELLCIIVNGHNTHSLFLFRVFRLIQGGVKWCGHKSHTAVQSGNHEKIMRQLLLWKNLHKLRPSDANVGAICAATRIKAPMATPRWEFFFEGGRWGTRICAFTFSFVRRRYFSFLHLPPCQMRSGCFLTFVTRHPFFLR